MDIIEIRRENLRRWIAEHGTPVKEKSLFSQLKSTGSFGEKVARRLEEQYKMGAFYLDTHQGGASAADLPGAVEVRVAEPGDSDFVEIPMVKLRLQAGVTGFQTEPERRDGGTLGMRRNWIERTGYKPSALIAIQVKGDSMEPSLYEDDIVVINTMDRRPVDGQVFAVNYEGEAVVKRLTRDAGDWWLTSDSADQRKHHRKLCHGDACIIIGRVVRKESDRI